MNSEEMDATLQYVRRLPKVELHLHLEGTLEPEIVHALVTGKNCAKKDGHLPVNKIEKQDRTQYNFADLQQFLDLYKSNCKLLKASNDFCNVTVAYFKRAFENQVMHVELFFNPQIHLKNGIPFSVFFEGIKAGAEEGFRRYRITFVLIMSFLRDLPVEEAFEVIRLALPYKEDIAAVGLDSAEIGYPCRLFTKVFEKCRELGWKTVAHAGEEGPSSNVIEAIRLLKVDRVDHGIKVLVSTLSEHPLTQMLKAGLKVTINSDDPAYFGGYIGRNFEECVKHLGLTEAQAYQCVLNSIQASFASASRKREMINKLEQMSSFLLASLL